MGKVHITWHVLVILLLRVSLCAFPETYTFGGLYMQSSINSQGATIPCCSSTISIARLALNQLNADPNFLPNGPKLDMQFRDDQFNPAVGLMEVINFQDAGIQIILGHSTSFTATTTVKAGTVFDLIQSSFSATSSLLSDRITYKYFSRVVPPDNFQIKAMMALLDHLYETTQQIQWKQVAIICTTDAYGLEFAKLFIALQASRGYSVLAFQQFLQGSVDLNTEMKELKGSKSRIFISVMTASDWQNVVLAAIKYEIIGDRYIWICPDGCTNTNTYTILGSDQIPDYTKVEYMTGMLGTRPYARNSGPDYDAFIDLWLSTDPIEYPGAGTTTSLSAYATFGWDMVMFMAKAFKAAYLDGQFDENGYINPDIMSEYVRNTTIEGLSGFIELDSNSERLGIYNFVNFIPSQGYWTPIGHWDELQGLFFDQDIVWFDNTTNIPDIDIREPFKYWSCDDKRIKTDPTGKTVKLHRPDGGSNVDDIDDTYYCDGFIDCRNLSDESSDGCSTNYLAIFIVYGVVTGALILIALILILITLLFGYIIKRKRLRAASPFFLFMLIFSVILGYCSTYAWYGQPHKAACGFQPWLLGLSVVSMISALLAKSFRIWRIFSSPFKKKSIKDVELFVLWLILVLPAVVILILWTIISTPTAKMDNVRDEDHYVCATGGFTGPPGGLVFFFILVGYEGVVLLFGAFLSFKTRKVPNIYNESSLIAISIYNLLFLCVIVIPVYLILLAYNPFAAWIIRTTAILYAFTATLWIQFIPILAGITIVDRCKDLDMNRLTTSSTSSPLSNTTSSHD